MRFPANPWFYNLLNLDLQNSHLSSPNVPKLLWTKGFWVSMTEIRKILFYPHALTPLCSNSEKVELWAPRGQGPCQSPGLRAERRCTGKLIEWTKKTDLVVDPHLPPLTTTLSTSSISDLGLGNPLVLRPQGGVLKVVTLDLGEGTRLWLKSDLWVSMSQSKVQILPRLGILRSNHWGQ